MNTKHDLRIRARYGQGMFDVKDGLTTSGGKLCARQACSSSSWRCSGYGLLKRILISMNCILLRLAKGLGKMGSAGEERYWAL